MPTIFVSHSKRDRKPIDFLNQAFASTNVQAKYEEIEAFCGQRTPELIHADIESSAAIFIVLGENVESLKHTRDWVAWEAGVGAKKDVWVFEAAEESVKLSVVIPRVHYYVSYEFTDVWLSLFRSIILSYDNTQVLQAAAMGAGLGALAGGGNGAALGGFIGTVLGSNAQTKSRPGGTAITCPNPKCKAAYNVFVTELMLMRCPVCNTRMRLGTAVTEPEPSNSVFSESPWTDVDGY